MKVILLGVTGYTGGLLLKQLLAKGIQPFLLGRNEKRLAEIAKQHGGLQWAHVNIDNLASLKKVIDAGDLLISTVGPFDKYGYIPLQAAIESKAHYMDSTGEPNFISKVYQYSHQEAEQAKTVVMTACGYDYVPGQLIGGLLVEKYGSVVDKLNIGYTNTTGKIASLSPGTIASLTKALFETGIFFNNKKLTEGFLGKNTWVIPATKKRVVGISIPGLECQELPKTYSQLSDVNVFLGWFGPFGSFVSKFNRFQHLLFKIPGYLSMMRKLSNKIGLRFMGQTNSDLTENPTLVVGEALTASGELVGGLSLTGHNAYVYTAEMMAWMAQQIHEERIQNYGIVGPVRAFGLDALTQAHKEINFDIKAI